MTLLESLALDISSHMHRAVEADKANDKDLALSHLEEVKRLQHQAHLEVWHKYVRSGEVK